MHTQKEKFNLLSDMIAFAIVDGKLHDKEYQFLQIVAQVLKVSKKDFNDLFHQELPKEIIKNEFERIQQFYRLALLMHCDGVLHEKEENAIGQIALEMGLNPDATKRVLKLMKKSTNAIIPSKVLLEIFQEQLN